MNTAGDKIGRMSKLQEEIERADAQADYVVEIVHDTETSWQEVIAHGIVALLAELRVHRIQNEEMELTITTEEVPGAEGQ